MLGRTYDSQLCSIARTLEVVGERWTLLIVRDAMLGLRRFEEFQDSLGIARNVLTNRLSKLVDDGLLDRVCYQERPARYEYQPTSKAKDLLTAVLSLMHWGDEYAGDSAALRGSRTMSDAEVTFGNGSCAPNAGKRWVRTPFTCFRVQHSRTRRLTLEIFLDEPAHHQLGWVRTQSRSVGWPA